MSETGAKQDQIGQCHGYDDEVVANAHLFAAAPDLLAAAKALLMSPDITSWDTKATIALRAAIAKAEGRS